MHQLTEFLFPAPARRTTGAILGWWERRRLPYNLIVGGAGVFSIASALLVRLLDVMKAKGIETGSSCPFRPGRGSSPSASSPTSATWRGRRSS